MNKTHWVYRRCAYHLFRLSKEWTTRSQSTGSRPHDGFTEPCANITVVKPGTARNLIYPPLLERARTIAAEHASLSERLERSYDAKIAKRAGELSPVVSELESWEKANEVYYEP